MRTTLLCAVCSLAVILACRSPLSACRPLALDDCPPVEKGRISLESGITSTQGPSSDQSMNETTSLKYGIADGADAGIDIPYLLLKQADGSYAQGIGDVTLKSKVSMIDHLSSWAGLSCVIAGKLSNGDPAKGLGSGFVDYGITAITTKALGESLIHANIGYTVTGDSSLRNSWQYGCSCLFPVAKGLHLAGEIIGGTNPDPGDGRGLLSTQVGFCREIGGIILDAGMNFGLSDANPANVITLGITLGF